jgi:hypothetical protein
MFLGEGAELAIAFLLWFSEFRVENSIYCSGWDLGLFMQSKKKDLTVRPPPGH